MAFNVYILYSQIRNRHYIGSTEDLQRRMEQHNSGRNLSTKAGVPWLLKHTENFATLKEARQREADIKRKKSRTYIEWLISSAG